MVSPLFGSPAPWTRFESGKKLRKQQVYTAYSYGHLPVISTYNPIYRMYNLIYNQL